jgi:RNA recognition motif-containing protein
MSSIFVGKLNQRTPESELHDCFSRYGKIKRIDFKLGFAFIFYHDEISCEEAIKGMRGNELDGHSLVVELSRSNKEFLNGPPNSFANRSEFRISVAGLDQNTSWQDLKDWARNAGSVKFADVLIKDGEKFGVIEYEVIFTF